MLNMTKKLEVIPAMVFLGYIRFIDTKIQANWKMPFLVSGCTAILVILYLLCKKQVANRILLGFNLYFITGGVAFITHQWWLNNLYGQLQASGLLLWVMIIGITTTLFNSYGFIGIKTTNIDSVKNYSLYLLFFSTIAFALSFTYRDNRVLSELISFISLFVLHGILRKKLVKILSHKS